MTTLLQWGRCKLQSSGLNNEVPFSLTQHWWEPYPGLSGEVSLLAVSLWRPSASAPWSCPLPGIVFRDPAKAGLVAQINLLQKTRKSVLAQMPLSPTALS